MLSDILGSQEGVFWSGYEGGGALGPQEKPPATPGPGQILKNSPKNRFWPHPRRLLMIFSSLFFFGDHPCTVKLRPGGKFLVFSLTPKNFKMFFDFFRAEASSVFAHFCGVGKSVVEIGPQTQASACVSFLNPKLARVV